MASTGRQPTTQPKPLKDGLPLPGSLRWWFHLPPERLSTKQQAQLTLLCESNVELATTYQLAQEFARLLRGQKEEELSGWLKKVHESTIIELVSFAKGLERDESAVRAGLSLPWSQGPVEGAVNRLKLIKPQYVWAREVRFTAHTSALCCIITTKIHAAERYSVPFFQMPFERLFANIEELTTNFASEP